MLKDKQKKDEVIEAAASGKVNRKEFEKELAKLQVELTRLQTWVKDKGARVIVVFEGRDTAGKGGVISRITARTSPRVYRHVALPVPSDREKTQVFIQRYIAHFPAAGEIVLFDRSWYNRAGVERVMGFVTDEDPPGRAGDDRQQRHHPAQVLSRCKPGRATAPVRGEDQRPGETLEAESDGH
jgi:polyphosphate kinase 2 (PPK2 family)